MQHRRIFTALAVPVLSLAILPPAAAVRADVRLPALFSDHMVLQRQAPVPIWGWADSGETVTVRMAGQHKSTTADQAGKWKLTLDKLSGSGPQKLIVAGRNTLTISDVLLGEVWLCSGQSNMGVPVVQASQAETEIASADHPDIRMFTVAPHGSLEPEAEAKGKWEVCSPKTVGHWSAVAYYFAWHLGARLQVPIGLVHSSVGGTHIDGWMRREVLDQVPELRETTAASFRRMQQQAEDARRFPPLRDRWEAKYHVAPPPNQGFGKGWADPALDDRDWKTVSMPARWSDAAGVKSGGVFWLRKTVTFPAGAAGKPFMLALNFMNDQSDTAYFNGEEIGHSGDEPPLFNWSQRRYLVPRRLVHEGKNVIALRIVSASERSDLLGRGAFGDYGLPIDRKAVGNQWKLKVESLFPPLPPEAVKTRPRPNGATSYNTPVVLYNAMIAPLVPYSIRGVIWYQGEADTSRPQYYQRLFSLLIEDWRQQWGEGEFPFFFVQLANFLPPTDDPNAASGWARLREAQARVADSVPGTGMAVTIDIGEADNIHPVNKREVGRRLALVAAAKSYGQDVEYSGPRLFSVSWEGRRIGLRFKHADGLFAKGGPVRGFAVAGLDRKFVWAEAIIEGPNVFVSSPKVDHPIAVRYAWADNPVRANLYNSAGLPASPFRTDTW